MFWKEEFVIFIYNHYIDGLSIEEIWFKLRLFDFGDLSFDLINEIIDNVNNTII
jgi:hypothetical protein